ncbi:ArsR family transcriptional regulator [Candidatus Acidianus copahuensis]|uniref:ArsR family transcriptional regulator n=1 Tax=Candidatus Acidianus copahuensis TaxID=1160895 RepID=A0A031LUD6_9CREN|nr:transcriptional regulator [Candidatus Acidianus copahuensis]EZQ11385.1 ArsR family transcriptional regulator [Candidatus Acidianus copahuensis]
MSEDVKKLMEFLNNKVLSNSVRLGILIGLYVFEKMTFSEIAEYTGQSKGSISLHIQVLEEAGLIVVKKVPTVAGPRTIIKITDKGRETVKMYFELIKKVNK